MKKWEKMDITFSCTKCGQHIAVDKSGAGLLVDCPKCGVPLEVPYSTSPESGKVAGESVKKPESGKTLERQPTAPTHLDGDTKKCPYCAETILAKAIKCKHCGEFLQRSMQTDMAKTSTTVTVHQLEEPAYNWTPGRVKLVTFGIIGVILLVIIMVLHGGVFWSLL